MSSFLLPIYIYILGYTLDGWIDESTNQSMMYSENIQIWIILFSFSAHGVCMCFIFVFKHFSLKEFIHMEAWIGLMGRFYTYSVSYFCSNF